MIIFVWSGASAAYSLCGLKIVTFSWYKPNSTVPQASVSCVPQNPCSWGMWIRIPGCIPAWAGSAAHEVLVGGQEFSVYPLFYDAANTIWLLVVLTALVLMKCKWNGEMGLNVWIWDCFGRQFCRKTCREDDQVLIEGVSVRMQYKESLHKVGPVMFKGNVGSRESNGII